MLAGGTDLMVEVNHGRRHLVDVVTLDQIPELSHWERNGDVFRLGSGLTYTALAGPLLADFLPGLAQAARTVGSPWAATWPPPHRPETPSLYLPPWTP